MLLERLVEKASEVPEYDWDGYYGWLYSHLDGEEGVELRFWVCRRCLTMNVICLPARYGKCSACNLLHLGHGLPGVKLKLR